MLDFIRAIEHNQRLTGLDESVTEQPLEREDVGFPIAARYPDRALAAGEAFAERGSQGGLSDSGLAEDDNRFERRAELAAVDLVFESGQIGVAPDERV